VRQIYPAPRDLAGQQADPVGDLARLYAYPGPGSRPWLRANMISSADGAVALAGRSGGLSGSADRLVFAVLRSLADVILVGAGTARAEGYRPVDPRQLIGRLRPEGAPPPPIAVITGRLDLGPEDGGLLAAYPGRTPSIVLTTRAAPADRRAAAARHAEVVVTGPATVTAQAAVAALAGRGYRKILAEGGPGLLGQITAAGLLDELCQTDSPVLAGGPAGRILTPPDPDREGPLAGLELAHVLEDNGYLLCRYLQSGQRPERTHEHGPAREGRAAGPAR
jgi:riboflavin biosynthesis pyrimidine reductase